MNFGGRPSPASRSNVAAHPFDVGTVLLDVDADIPGPLHLKSDQCAGEGGPVDQYNIAGLEEEPAGDVEAVLSASW